MPSALTRQQQQRDDAAAAHQVPDRARGEHAVHAAASGQPHGGTRSCRRGGRGGRGGPRARARPRRHSPRTIAAVLAVLASTQRAGGDADGAPDLGGGQARARVDDVVALGAAGAPAAHRGARRGEPAAASAIVWPRRVASLRWSSVTRTASRRRARARRAAMSPPRLTSAPAPGRGVHGARAAVGGERLRGRAEVDLDAGRDVDDAAGAVDARRAPAGGGDDAQARRLAAARDDDGEVAVPAERAQRAADGGVDVAVGARGGVAARRERLQQERAGRERRAGRAVEPGELGVVAEAAAGSSMRRSSSWTRATRLRAARGRRRP